MKFKTFLSIIFSFLLVISLPITLWNIEITMDWKEGVYLTNGFQNFNPIQLYHLRAYAIMLINFYIGFLLISYAINEEKAHFYNSFMKKR